MHAVTADGLEETLAALDPEAGAWAKACGFKADAGAVLLVPGDEKAVAAVLFGLGKADDPARPAFLTGRLPASLPDGLYRLATFEGDLSLAVLGWALGCYRFERYVKPKEKSLRLVMPSTVDAKELESLAGAVFMVRDLVNTPANDLGPAELAAAAFRLANDNGGHYREVVGEDLLTENYPLIHAVGAASSRAPRLIDFTWGDETAPKVTLVGKGVCFDTGGLNIKPDSSMLLMKKDMGGAANVLGLARLIMEAKLKLRLRVLIPAVENSISGNAFRPGDIFPSRKGLTVEIGNTDAEGRLVLADALALADEEETDLIVDMATLTGAARVALGPDLPPVYTHDDTLAADLASAGESVGDPLWRMPLWAQYDKLLASKVADVNHISSGGFAGSITAALFLARFVENTKSWLHADIFAWVPAEKPGQPVGGEAQVIRALFEVLKSRYPA
nr:leucyl aminopeptidase family protein [Hartmannibacter diazotrophicus]